MRYLQKRGSFDYNQNWTNWPNCFQQNFYSVTCTSTYQHLDLQPFNNFWEYLSTFTKSRSYGFIKIQTLNDVSIFLN